MGLKVTSLNKPLTQETQLNSGNDIYAVVKKLPKLPSSATTASAPQTERKQPPPIGPKPQSTQSISTALKKSTSIPSSRTYQNQTHNTMKEDEVVYAEVKHSKTTSKSKPEEMKGTYATLDFRHIDSQKTSQPHTQPMKDDAIIYADIQHANHKTAASPRSEASTQKTPEFSDEPPLPPRGYEESLKSPPLPPRRGIAESFSQLPNKMEKVLKKSTDALKKADVKHSETTSKSKPEEKDQIRLKEKTSTQPEEMTGTYATLDFQHIDSQKTSQPQTQPMKEDAIIYADIQHANHKTAVSPQSYDKPLPPLPPRRGIAESFSQLPNKLEKVLKKSTDAIKKFASEHTQTKKSKPLLVNVTHKNAESAQATQKKLDALKKTTDRYANQPQHITYRYESMLEGDPPKNDQELKEYKSELVKVTNLILNNSELNSSLDNNESDLLNTWTKQNPDQLALNDIKVIKNICQKAILQARISVVHHALGTQKSDETPHTKPQLQALKKLSNDLSFSVHAGIFAELQQFIHKRTDTNLNFTPAKKDQERHQNVKDESPHHIPLMNSHEFQALGMLFTEKDSKKPAPKDSLNVNLSIPRVFGQLRTKNNQFSFSLRTLDKSMQKIRKIQQQTKQISQQLVAERTNGSQNDDGKVITPKTVKLAKKQKKLNEQLKKEYKELDKKTDKIAKSVATVVMRGIKHVGKGKAGNLPFTEKSPLFQKTSNNQLNTRQMAALHYLYKVATESVMTQ